MRVLLVFAIVALTGCSSTVVGGTRGDWGDSDACGAACVQKNKAGGCVKFTSDMADICRRYLGERPEEL